MKQTWKRIGSLLLSVCMILTMQPATTGNAAVEIQNGLPAITVGTGTNSSPTLIGFGGRQWDVIGYDGNGVASTQNTMTLLLKTPYVDDEGKDAVVQFNEPIGSSHFYSGSTFQAAINGAYSELADTREQNMVLPRDLPGGGGLDDEERVAGDDVLGAKFWPLSLAEAKQMESSLWLYSVKESWWLRSPSYDPNIAECVAPEGFRDGKIFTYGEMIMNYCAIRPAFCLNLASVLFTSAAGNGKSTTIGSNLVSTTSTNSAVKLTVQDASQTLDLHATLAQSTQSGATLSFRYANATTGINQYVSCVLVNSSNQAAYYGKLTDSSSAASGSLSIPLANVNDGTYTIKIFSEQINGDNYTDFCSTPVTMTLAVTDGIGEVSNFSGQVGTIVTTAAELKVELEKNVPDVVTVGQDITMNVPIELNANHTLIVPNGKTLSTSLLSGINIGTHTLTVKGGGTLNSEMEDFDLFWGEGGVLNLENITINLKNTDNGGLRVYNVNMNTGAVINIDSETGSNMFEPYNLVVNSGATLNIKNFKNDAVRLASAAKMYINGGSVYISHGAAAGNHVGIKNLGTLDYSAGSLEGCDFGAAIYLDSNSKVQGMNNMLKDRGTVLNNAAEVNVIPELAGSPPSAIGPTTGAYLWDGNHFAKSIPITWSELNANGTANYTNTTYLTLTFSANPETLAIGNIEVTGATKGSLTGSGVTRKLTISNITVGEGEKVTVAIADPVGYDITPNTMEVVVHRAPVVTGPAQTLVKTLTDLGFSAIVNDSTVTVNGSKTDVTQKVSLDIPSGITVKWGAELTGKVESMAMLSVANEGNLEIVSGAKLSNTASVGTTLDSYKDGSVLVSGGELSFTGSYGVPLSVRNGVCVIKGGTVSSGNNDQLWLDGTLAVISSSVSISKIVADNLNGPSAVVRLDSTQSSALIGSAEGLTVTPYHLEDGDSLTTQWLVRDGVSGINVLKNQSMKYWFAPYSGVTIHLPLPTITLTITTDALPRGTVGSVYSQTLMATGDTPITWSIESGSLPNGLNLNGSTGEISGIPTSSGNLNFTVKATNNMGSATKALSMIIGQFPVPTYSVTIGTLSGGSITASPAVAVSGSSITLTITPDSGKQLKAGSLKYNDGAKDVAIIGTSFTLPDTNVTVTAEFENIPVVPVQPTDPVLVSIGIPAAITGVANGTAKSAAALGLPASVVIITTDGNSNATVVWDVAGSNYNQSSLSMQSFTVTGNVNLPTGVVNTNHINLSVTISVTVNQGTNPDSNTGGNSNNGNGTGGSNQSAGSNTGTNTGNNKNIPIIAGSELSGWASITQFIADNNTGNITVNMNGETTVTPEVLEAVRGKDIDLTFDLGNGIEWIINGTEIPESMDTSLLQGIDFNLSMNTDSIPAELLDELVDSDKVQISLEYDGSFGFTATLRLPMDEKYSGKYANLFYYNPVTKQLELQAVGVVNANGTVEFPFTHASDYVIVMSDAAMFKEAIWQITVSPEKKTLYVGGTKGNSVSVTAAIPEVIQKAVTDGLCDMTITYESSNPKIAAISASGKIAAKKTGTVTITTTFKVNGVEKSYQTIIKVKKAYIKLTKSTKTMKLGETYHFQAVGYGVKTEDIVFTTSQKAIMTINKRSGVAAAKSAGVDYVIAKTGDIEVKIKVVIQE